MKTSVLALFLCVGLLFGPSPVDEDDKKTGFLIDRSRHYVYIKFDHIAAREPLSPDEPKRGLWLRLVNNCRIPIIVAIFDTGHDNPGVGVFDEVVPVEAKRLLPVFDSPGRHEHPSKTSAQSREEPPEGYSPPDVFSTTTISPGQNLLFNLPLNHVGPSWYLQVRFYLELPGEGYSSGPYSVVSFDWQDIPKEFRENVNH